MTARKKVNNEVPEEEAISLSSLLSNDSDSGGDYYGTVDGIACVRLIHCVTAIGAFVTFWRDGANQRLCFSVRIGTQKRSYQVEESAMFSSIAEDVVGKLTPTLVSRRKPPPPPLR